MVDVSADPEVLHPLTYGQRWLHHVALSSPTLARPVQRIYRLPGRPVDTAGLLRGFRRVVAANEALRLRLVQNDDGWWQRFPEWVPDIEGLVVTGRTAEQRLAYGLHSVVQHASTSLDLTVDPPLAAYVVRVDDEYLLALTVDHLAADDLGFDQLELQLARVYEAETRGEREGQGSLPEAGRFLRYIAREQSIDRSATALAYWRAVLEGAPISKDGLGSNGWVPGSAALIRLDKEELRAFTSRCRARGFSPFVAVLTAQAILLCRLDGGQDLVINVPVSNRASADDHSLVANLSMLLHLRIRIDPSESVQELGRRVRDLVLEAMVYRAYDYRALSAVVVEDARARGGRVHWTAGCSYVVERPERAVEVAPVLERIDQELPPHPDVPCGTFAISCRQQPRGLSLEVLWDLAVWSASEAEIVTQLRQLLDDVTGLDQPVRRLAAI